MSTDVNVHLPQGIFRDDDKPLRMDAVFVPITETGRRSLSLQITGHANICFFYDQEIEGPLIAEMFRKASILVQEGA